MASQQQLLFSKFVYWWDNRGSRRMLNSKHNINAELWLDSLQKPAWVDLHSATWGTEKQGLSEFVCTTIQFQGVFAAEEGQSLLGVCSKLCKEGLIADAVHVLNLLVQQGFHVRNHLFYRLLKKCIANKDLVLGRKVHALSAQSGYEQDEFLATHLIGLYASHGRLEEAMQVFSRVPTPSCYNWATILFAFARQGQAAQAIRMYRQMRELTVQPDNRVYVAILKACAIEGDLVAGEEVHAQILASPLKLDNFVQTGLVNMYAKCGSLEKARFVFDNLTSKNLVIWNAMFAGYAQQKLGLEALTLYCDMQQGGLSSPDAVTFVSLLQACASLGVGALQEGRQLHLQIEERGLQLDGALGGSLVNMYANCGSIQDARQMFDKISQKDLIIWNVMLAGYALQGMGHEALCLFRIMQVDASIDPDVVTFTCLLQACASIGAAALREGELMHSQIKERGLQDDVVLGGCLVNMYAKCGSVQDARSFFARLRHKNVVTWNTMLGCFAQHAMCEEAFSLYNSMQEEGLTFPSSVTFVSLLQACATVGIGALHQGRLLHVQIKERGLEHDEFLGSSLVNMYTKCGSVTDARRVFDRLSDKNIGTWNVLFAGYAQQEMGLEALKLHKCMQRDGLLFPTTTTFVCLLQACASIGVTALCEGKELHVQIEERGLQIDVVVGGSLINMYAKCGSIVDARTVFDTLRDKNIVTWNSMISGYVQHGLAGEALSLYSHLKEEGLCPSSVTLISLVQACADVGVEAVQKGKELHVQIEQQGLNDDAVVGGSLVNMYVKCGNLGDARCVFEKLSERNVVTWTAMISGYAQQGMGQEVLRLYNSMQKEIFCSPDAVTFVCLLDACASIGVEALSEGRQLHAQIAKRGLDDNVVVGGSLVSMYSKCGSLVDARCVFDKLVHRNVITWNAMLGGYVQEGMAEEALSVYSSMQQDHVSPDSVTFVYLLQACATITDLPLGAQLHAEIQERDLQGDAVVGTALVHMYAKCGSVIDSQRVFDSLPEKTIEAWCALMGGYSRQGQSKVVFDLLDRIRLERIQPNGIAFLIVLALCSYVGLVDEGRKYFQIMTTTYGLNPSVQHYTCMIDLLGRAGHLEEALWIATTMPFRPDDAVWLTLLSARQKWGLSAVRPEGVRSQSSSTYL